MRMNRVIYALVVENKVKHIGVCQKKECNVKKKNGKIPSSN